MPGIRTSVVPDLIDAIVAAMDAAVAAAKISDPNGILADLNVIDGPQLDTGDQDSLQVGVSDPDSTDLTTAATGSETPGPFSTNHPRDERGEIYLTATSWGGDSDEVGTKTARDRVYAIAGAVATIARTNPSWGVSGLLWTGYGSNHGLRQSQDNNGARAVLNFRISYRARI
jgi:hypothetical protein